MATQILDGWIVLGHKDRIVTFGKELAPKGSKHSIKFTLKKEGVSQVIRLIIITEDKQTISLLVDSKIPPGTGALASKVSGSRKKRS
jgi:hypothetical protein